MRLLETADALLVVDRENSEAVRSVVDALARAERRESVMHAREVRPWGRFTVLQQEPGYKVKEVVVDPHGRLTLQYHPGRDETWVIVAGEALVLRDGEQLRLQAGQSITVPRGARHQLTNPGSSPLRLIEIGFGEALGDEDTVRLDG